MQKAVSLRATVFFDTLLIKSSVEPPADEPIRGRFNAFFRAARSLLAAFCVSAEPREREYPLLR